MSTFYVEKTEGRPVIVEGDRMIEKGDFLCIYRADELIAMVRMDYITDAHRTG